MISVVARCIGVKNEGIKNDSGNQKDQIKYQVKVLLIGHKLNKRTIIHLKKDTQKKKVSIHTCVRMLVYLTSVYLGCIYRYQSVYIHGKRGIFDNNEEALFEIPKRIIILIV